MPYIPEEEKELTIKLTSPPKETPVISHEHIGIDSPRIKVKNLKGLIEVVDDFWTRLYPTKPIDIYNQIKISINGTTSSLCIYNYNLGWRCVQLVL